MNHPDFKHRALPAGGNYDEFDNVDLLAFVDGSIDHIQNTIALMSTQYQSSEDSVLFGDEVNLKILNEIRLSVLDMRAMFDWFLNNHEIVRTNNEYHPEDYAEEFKEPGSGNEDGGNKTLN